MKIRSLYNTTKTPTGRIYCEDYNVMQMPHPMREAVVPTLPGNQFFCADYKAQEFRILISLANETKLLEAVRQGRDVHKMAVAAALRIPEDSVTEFQRNEIGKVLNYGLAYGGTAYTVQKATGLPTDECQTILDNYFREFKAIKAWQDRVKAEGPKGKVTNCFGYTRNFGKEIGRTGKPENLALNTMIQSAGACLLKRAIVKLSELPSVVVRTCVHDSVLVEFDPKQVTPTQMVEIMEWTPEGWVSMEIDWEVSEFWS